MILYASDLDRTLIYSNKFISEHPTDAPYTPVEYKEDKVISNMADEVHERLLRIKDNKDITFVPVTTRSIDEYNRINLGFTPEYAIMSNGGTILKDGKPMEEWAEYIKSKINYMEAIDIINLIEEEMQSVNYKIKMIDNCYLFFKTDNPDLFDAEVLYLMAKFPNWEFTRQVRKCYAIPKHFSKQIALRWLYNKLNRPYLVASGDSELDLPMLAIANRAIIPTHGSLVTDKFVEDGTFADGGITSPLFTMDIVEKEAEERKQSL